MKIRLENLLSGWQWHSKLPQEIVGASVLGLHHVLCSVMAKRSSRRGKSSPQKICVIRASHVQIPLAEV